MIIIGSRALAHYLDIGREPNDWDIYMDEKEFKAIYSNPAHRFYLKRKGANRWFLPNAKVEIKVVNPDFRGHMFWTDIKLLNAVQGQSGKVPKLATPIGMAKIPSLALLGALKQSCIGLINKPCHAADLKLILDSGVKLDEPGIYEFIAHRVNEIKERLDAYQFFNKYKILRFVEHDVLHEWVAEMFRLPEPTMKKFVTGTTVDVDKFQALSNDDQISAIAEEVMVLMVERFAIPQVYQNKGDLWFSDASKYLLILNKIAGLTERPLQDNPDCIREAAVKHYEAIAARLLGRFWHPSADLLVLAHQIRSGVAVPI